ncbi:MAG: hypothetical protein IJ362_05445, partial [Oscillospiraceae bacterium]|nr:hypothetical protein [Oscillospiraceae bacterium]
RYAYRLAFLPAAKPFSRYAIHESGHLHTVGICDAGHGKPQWANTVRPYACHSEGASRGIFVLKISAK